MLYMVEDHASRKSLGSLGCGVCQGKSVRHTCVVVGNLCPFVTNTLV